MAEIVKKTDYENEYFSLAREQYKRKPKFAAVMQLLGREVQEIEDAFFTFEDLRPNFGTNADSPRDPLNQTARMFGILNPETMTTEVLSWEIKGTLVTIFSRGFLEDIKRLSQFVFGLRSNLVESGGGVVVTVYGNISSNSGQKAKLIYKYAKRMIPAGNEIHSVNEAKTNSFAFVEKYVNGSAVNGFNSTGTWRSGGASNLDFVFSRVVIDRLGNLAL